MSEELFDLSEEYEVMLNQGIGLSGEDMFFFIDGRLAALKALLRGRERVVNCLDFGCGLGHATKRFADSLGVKWTGIDTSENALQAARQRNGGPNTRYLTLAELDSDPAQYDLCYVNGVFHHIPPAERAGTVALIQRKLRPSGRLFLFENNPWNPGARMVMARIPFDRDAIMMSPRETARLVRGAGLEVESVSSYFFFPRSLKVFRPLEPILQRSHLGAQYLVVSRKEQLSA